MRGWEKFTVEDIRRMEAAARRGREVLAALPEPDAKPTKYRTVKTTIDGIVFDSKAEAYRWVELRWLQRGKQICELERQPEYVVTVAGVKICSYRADFKYLQWVEGDGWKLVVEDVKGWKTLPLTRLKIKLVEALYGISITEVRRK